VATLAKAGADFISLREAIWDDARGPAAALKDAQSLLEAHANARERE
jgi:thiamine monophosphate synthase